jgi:hypothetical protein
MPQLVKGGKWVFGWSIVGENYQLSIPPAAYTEYGFQAGEALVFLHGSKRSGGFALGKREKVLSSVLYLRIFAETEMEEQLCFNLPDPLDTSPGQRFLVVRGSGLALSFLQYGSIYEEALRHPEIEVFAP